MASNYKKLKTNRKAEKIYKEIAEEDKRLAEDFLSISFVDFESIRKEMITE